MYTAYQTSDRPFVIRYPRGKGELENWQNTMELLPVGKGRQLHEGSDIAVLSIGSIGNEVIKAVKTAEKEGISVAHYDMIFLKPLDETLLHNIGKRFAHIITVENGTVIGGLGTAVAEFMCEHGYTPRIKRIGIPDAFIEHGSIPELFRRLSDP